ncbi:metalloendoproteinase 5-MMP [Eucalyptus grandis]|uniref:metalloendoproteinase 5-MMP n=1 Tax=Eucalyptus grandis TaxID=71139 RepID=UPI00192E837A|nr:metalloendoproteinase 5-MMP [Eucalyptus grandis]
MVPKISCSFVAILVLFLAIRPSTVHSRSLKSTDPSLTSFQSLEGVLKGQTKQGIKEVKRYLRAFGYWGYEEDENEVALMDDEFDETLESALQSYQRFYHLEVTGKLDADTVNQMSAPRCGVPDAVHPRHAEWNATKPSKLRIVARYNFFPNKPRWPPTKTHLNYAFGPVPAAIPLEELRGVCSRAFQRWADVTSFTFSEASAGGQIDLVIGFYRGDHGDGYPFDGPGKILAHSFSPTDGRFHYDVEEQWSTNPSSTQFDLESVTLHEIGHLLGLAHTPDQNAVMFATISPGAQKRDLRQDDIDGIHALYAA